MSNITPNSSHNWEVIAGHYEWNVCLNGDIVFTLDASGGSLEEEIAEAERAADVGSAFASIAERYGDYIVEQIKERCDNGDGAKIDLTSSDASQIKVALYYAWKSHFAIPEPYKVDLNYGYCYSHETYECYHSFELTDTDDHDDDIGWRLADDLDTTPDDEDFNWDIMSLKVPDALVRKIQKDFIDKLLGMKTNSEEQVYENYKLFWMLTHGHTLSELVSELAKIQYADPEDSDQISTPVKELFEQWEQDAGFGSEIWPCFNEFMDSDYNA